jgi:DoxX-like family
MLKFWHPGAVLAYLSSMGFEDADVYLIAVIELTTAVLLLFPCTRGLGVLIASAYLGGAVAAHLAIQNLVSVLANEVVLYADGGGKANAALRPVHAAANVARFVLGAIAKSVPKDVSVSIEGAPRLMMAVP